MRPSPGEATLRKRGLPERAARSTCNAMGDPPGFYAAFPWGGYAQSKGAAGTRSNATGTRTRSIFPSLSPASSTPGSFIRPRWLLTEKYTESLHPERPARGALLYTGQSRPCIEHKGPPSTKNMHTKDGHDSRGRNYKLRRSSPRSRGPPSQSESYVWDKALICRRPGESNSSI